MQKCEGCPDINDKLDLGVRIGGGGMKTRGLGLGLDEGGVYDAGFKTVAGAGGDASTGVYVGEQPAVGKRKVVSLRDTPVAKVARPNIGVLQGR